MSDEHVLVLNAGSSSLKAGVFVSDGAAFAGERALLTAEASGIGQEAGKLEVLDGDNQRVDSGSPVLRTQSEAFLALRDALRRHGDANALRAVGHRVVHGGPRLRRHTRITPQVLSTLREAVHFAPLHLPGAISMIEQVTALYPRLPQVLCLDTAFHRTLPALARRLPVPQEFVDAGVERYGFHGLSYESLAAQLRALPEPFPDRVILAHLGGGSSLCAMYRGRSVDTTMGLTPAGGVIMSTRTGDLDPGVLLFLARAGRLSLDALEETVNHRGGMQAVCGISDFQTVQATLANGKSQANAAARLAFEQFAEGIAKSIASFLVSLSGMDLLVFSGGIGEHSPLLRAAVVERLGFLGLRLDPEANRASSATIHAAQSKAPIRVLPALEDPIIASHTRQLL